MFGSTTIALMGEERQYLDVPVIARLVLNDIGAFN